MELPGKKANQDTYIDITWERMDLGIGGSYEPATRTLMLNSLKKQDLADKVGPDSQVVGSKKTMAGWADTIAYELNHMTRTTRCANMSETTPLGELVYNADS